MRRARGADANAEDSSADSAARWSSALDPRERRLRQLIGVSTREALRSQLREERLISRYVKPSSPQVVVEEEVEQEEPTPEMPSTRLASFSDMKPTLGWQLPDNFIPCRPQPVRCQPRRLELDDITKCMADFGIARDGLAAPMASASELPPSVQQTPATTESTLDLDLPPELRVHDSPRPPRNPSCLAEALMKREALMRADASPRSPPVAILRADASPRSPPVAISPEAISHVAGERRSEDGIKSLFLDGTRLKELAALRDDGIISEEVFESRQREILGEHSAPATVVQMSYTCRGDEHEQSLMDKVIKLASLLDLQHLLPVIPRVVKEAEAMMGIETPPDAPRGRWMARADALLTAHHRVRRPLYE